VSIWKVLIVDCESDSGGFGPDDFSAALEMRILLEILGADVVAPHERFHSREARLLPRRPARYAVRGEPAGYQPAQMGADSQRRCAHVSDKFIPRPCISCSIFRLGWAWLPVAIGV
jgi:hypothetical protein